MAACKKKIWSDPLINYLVLNPDQMYPELNEDDLSLFNCLSIEGQGMSLFNCQMKIFVKWYENWTASQRSEFAHQINTIDPELISSISAQFQCHPRSQAQFVLRWMPPSLYQSVTKNQMQIDQFVCLRERWLDFRLKREEAAWSLPEI